MNLKEKVFQSVKWLFIAQISSQIIRTIVTLYVVRGFDEREMSYVALSLSITAFLDIFSTLGLNAAVISKKDVSKSDLQNIFGLVLSINVVLILIVFLGAPYFSAFYNTPEIANILKVTSVSFVFVAIGFIPNAMLLKQMRFRAISCIQVTSGLGGALTSYLCAKNGLGYWSLVYGGISISLIGTVLRVAVSRTVVWPRLSFQESIKNIRFGSYVMAGGMSWYFFVSMDIVIAGKFWTPEILDIYALAVMVVAMPLNRTLPLLKSVALPAYSRSIVEDRTLLESHTTKGLKLSLLISIPMFWGAAATAALLVPIFLGEKWLSVVLPLAFLCMGAPFRFIIELLSPAVIAVGYPKEIFKNTVVISLVMMAFYFTVVLNSTSPTMLAAVWMLVYPALVLHAAYKYCQLLDIKFRAVLKGISPVLISGFVMCVAVVLLVSNLFDKLNHILLLGLAVVTGFLLYIGTLHLADRTVLIDLLSMYRRPKASSKA